MSNILVVYGHPETPDGFNAAVLSAATAALVGEGHDVVVRDLYALGFDPVLSAADLAALHSGRAPADVKAEQEFVEWAHCVAFIYPIWWAGPPAMVKGYFDRVLASGFAYGQRDGRTVGLLSGRRAMVVNSGGNPEAEYERAGFYAAIRKCADDGLLRFCGFDGVRHVFYGGMSGKSATERAACVADAARKLVQFAKEL